jgi:hypothetical protein
MGGFAPDGHLTVEAIGDFVDGVLPNDANEAVEQHLTSCDACTQLVQTTRRFELAWKHLSAETYGAAYRRYRERQRVAGTETQKDETVLGDHAQNWREKWKGQAAAAVRVIMDAREEATRLVTEGVEALLAPNPRWQFAYGGGGTKTRGTEVSQPDQTIVVAHEDPGVQIFVERPAKRIVIKLPVSGPPDSVPRAVLVNDETGMEIEGLLQPLQPGTRFCLIIFEGVDDGEHTLMFPKV